jgi:hypothetical protein
VIYFVDARSMIFVTSSLSIKIGAVVTIRRRQIAGKINASMGWKSVLKTAPQ